MPFWRWYLLMLVVGQSLSAILLPLAVYLPMKQNPLIVPAFWWCYLSGVVAMYVVFAFVATVYIGIWLVRISPTALSGFNSWGIFITVRWDSIYKVKHSWVPLLPAVKVYSTDTWLVMWLPLFLINYPAFAKRVAEYAGPQHPLTQYIRSRLDPEEA